MFIIQKLTVDRQNQTSVLHLVDLLLVLMNEFDLRRGQVSDLFPDDVQVRLPGGEERVELLPMLRRESSVHRRRHVNNLVGLVDLGTNKLRLQN